MPRFFNAAITKRYLSNLFRHKIIGKKYLKPFVACYYLTYLCNFRCNYCEFAQKKWTSQKGEDLNTNQAIKLLKLIRKECPNIYLTGGEPLIRRDIVEILKACKSLGFKFIVVNTNLSLYHCRKEILDYVDFLVVSMDSLNAENHSKNLGISKKAYNSVIDNILEISKLQRKKNFKLVINCVCTPSTIDDSRDVMNFCFKNNILFAFVPASVGESSKLIDKGFINNKKYASFVNELIERKKRNFPVFNTYGYLKKIRNFEYFRCIPSLSLRINPKGELIYPCEPLRKTAGNILVEGSCKKALKKAIQEYGQLPNCSKICYKSCYIEMSQFINNPLQLITEVLTKFKK